MAKQKVVVKVTMESDKQTRKAMKVAVNVPGVESVALVGPNKEQIAVTGEGFDSVQLAIMLRKNLGYADILSVGLIEEKKPAKSSQKETKDIPMLVEYPYLQHYYGHSVPLQVFHEVPSNSCTIM